MYASELTCHQVFSTDCYDIGCFTTAGQPGNWVIPIGLYKNSFQVFIVAFTAINQSYFMCLFFFISAYFIPSSVDKRGPTVFLKDRFKRLGIH